MSKNAREVLCQIVFGFMLGFFVLSGLLSIFCIVRIVVDGTDWVVLRGATMSSVSFLFGITLIALLDKFCKD